MMGALKMEWRTAKEVHGSSPFFTNEIFCGLGICIAVKKKGKFWNIMEVDFFSQASSYTIFLIFHLMMMLLHLSKKV
jgi:hypothetical protein